MASKSEELTSPHLYRDQLLSYDWKENLLLHVA